MKTVQIPPFSGLKGDPDAADVGWKLVLAMVDRVASQGRGDPYTRG